MSDHFLCWIHLVEFQLRIILIAEYELRPFLLDTVTSKDVDYQIVSLWFGFHSLPQLLQYFRVDRIMGLRFGSIRESIDIFFFQP